MDIIGRMIGADVEIMGRNGTVGTSFEELYAYDQALSWPTILAAAAKMDVTSSSTADQASVSKGAATMTVANPCVVTLNSHALITGDEVKFTTDGALPTGLVASQIYYAGVINANTFNLHATLADAVAGVNKIETTGTQSGTHTLFGPLTGARKVIICGLDGNYKLIYEEIRLNGQTIVTTTKAFLRVFGAECTNAGSGGVNAGDIHIVKTGTGGTYTTGVPGTLTSAICKILTGYGTSGNGMYTVPAGKVATLKGILFTARAQACTFQLASQKPTDLTDNSLHTDMPVEIVITNSTYMSAFELGIKHGWDEKTDIRLRALAAGASGICSAVMFLDVRDK